MAIMAQNGTKRKCNDKKENKILGIMAENNSIPQFVNSDSFMADKNYVKWLSDLKKRFRVAQLKAAVKVNTEMLKFYWSLGEDICEKQKQYKWGANFMKRLSLDLRAEFPQAEGFSWSNLYKIRKWYLFYSSQIDFLYQAGTKLQKVDNATIPMPEILLFVPWRHQTVIVSKCDTINAALFYLNKVVEDNMSRTELESVKWTWRISWLPILLVSSWNWVRALRM
jgi:predicted nuclease of restriction endonuclease-like (RecB) superfamily